MGGGNKVPKGIYLPGLSGVFAVNKPSGPSSQEIVSRLKNVISGSDVFEDGYRHVYGGAPRPRGKGRNRQHRPFIRIGHGGTLDPIATGVLVMGLGKATQELVNYLQNSTKTYRAVAMFGAATDSYDSEGKVLRKTSVKHLTDDLVRETLKKFEGRITQLPPVFSALKMDGKPLYDYAREGKPLPRPIEPRECDISDIGLPFEGGLVWDHDYTLPTMRASFDEKLFNRSVARAITPEDIAELEQEQDTLEEGEKVPILTVDFTVSSGTYIRTLIHDLGLALNTTAHMVKLTRISQGPWILGKNVLDLDELELSLESSWWPKLKAYLDHGPDLDIEEVRKMASRQAPQHAPAPLPVIPKVVKEHESQHQYNPAAPRYTTTQPPETNGGANTLPVAPVAAIPVPTMTTISPEIATLAKSLGLAVPGSSSASNPTSNPASNPTSNTVDSNNNGQSKEKTPDNNA